MQEIFNITHIIKNVEQTNCREKNLDKSTSSLLIFIIFSSLPALIGCRLLSYNNIYNLFSRTQTIISFSLQFVGCWSFVFGSEIWHFWKRRGRNFAEAPSIIQHKIVDLYPSGMSKTSMWTEEAFMVKDYQHTHTHTHIFKQF